MNNQSKYTKLEPNAAAALSYLIPILTGVVFLVVEKEDKFVRFHALQSIMFWAAYVVIYNLIKIFGVFGIGYYINSILALATFLAWLFIMWKAYENVQYKIPIIGDFAEKNIK